MTTSAEDQGCCQVWASFFAFRALWMLRFMNSSIGGDTQWTGSPTWRLVPHVGHKAPGEEAELFSCPNLDPRIDSEPRHWFGLWAVFRSLRRPQARMQGLSLNAGLWGFLLQCFPKAYTAAVAPFPCALLFALVMLVACCFLRTDWMWLVYFLRGVGCDTWTCLSKRAVDNNISITWTESKLWRAKLVR